MMVNSETNGMRPDTELVDLPLNLDFEAKCHNGANKSPPRDWK